MYHFRVPVFLSPAYIDKRKQRQKSAKLHEYYLDQVSGRLYIRLSKVYDKYTKYRKDYAIAGEVLPYAQFKKQLLHSDIVIDSNIQRKFNGKNARCWVINYRALLEHGLDVSGFETDVMSS